MQYQVSAMGYTKICGKALRVHLAWNPKQDCHPRRA